MKYNFYTYNCFYRICGCNMMNVIAIVVCNENNWLNTVWWCAIHRNTYFKASKWNNMVGESSCIWSEKNFILTFNCTGIFQTLMFLQSAFPSVAVQSCWYHLIFVNLLFYVDFEFWLVSIYYSLESTGKGILSAVLTEVFLTCVKIIAFFNFTYICDCNDCWK